MFSGMTYSIVNSEELYGMYLLCLLIFFLLISRLLRSLQVSPRNQLVNHQAAVMAHHQQGLHQNSTHPRLPSGTVIYDTKLQ
jgi:hypothetical protein